MWKKLICTVLLTLLLAGCQAEASQESPLTDQLLAGLPYSPKYTLPDRVIATGEGFSYRRKSGQCYLYLGKNNSKINLYDGGCVIPLGSLEFENMEQLYDFLRLGMFDQASIDTIRYGFPLDSNQGFLMPDPEVLYSIHLPVDMEITRVSMRGSKYEIWMRQTTHSSRPTTASFSVLTKDEFETSLQQLAAYAQEDYPYSVVQKTLQDRDAICYDFTAPAGEMRSVQYFLKDAQSVSWVNEKYTLKLIPSGYGSSTEPTSVSVYGYDRGVYYRISISNLSKAPSAEWLKEFRPTAYPG